MRMEPRKDPGDEDDEDDGEDDAKKRTSTREADPDETKPVSLANLHQNFRSKLVHPISADQVELSDDRGALVNWLEGVVEVEDPIALLLRLAIS